jgi:hypothetical protein
VVIAIDDGEMSVRVAEIRSELDSLVGEAVVEFGVFAAPGYVHSGVRRSAVPGTTWWSHLTNRLRQRRGSSMPLQVYLVLTVSRIVAVSMDTSWRSARSGFPIEVVRSWGLSSTKVKVTPAKMGVEVRLRDEDGETSLQSADHGRGFNHGFLAALEA